MIKNSPGAKEPLPEEVQRQLTCCEGYLDLKMARKAEQELERVDPAYRGSLHYRLMLVGLLTLKKDWATAQPIAAAMREEFPDEPGCWIQDAYLTRRARDIESARAILEKALARFPDESVIEYNLACYACRLGNHEEARQRLKTAIDHDDKWLKVALDDEDLLELHADIEDWS